MFSHGGEPRGYRDRLAGWQLAPGPLTAAAMQSAAAALCGTIGWIFDSAAFAAGLGSFASPGVLPLAPPYASCAAGR